MELPNTSLGQQSLHSSTRNQWGRVGDKCERCERSHFPRVSWLSVTPTGTKLSPSNADSTYVISSSLGASSPCRLSTSQCLSVALSPMDHLQHLPAPGSCPEMTTQSSCTMHTFSVTIPRTILHEMITVSVKKGDQLDVVAGAWHMEQDCELDYLTVL